MTKKEKWKACEQFFMDLCEAAKDKYELVGSCNQDNTLYLIPKGTEDQITYHSKPEYSFRLSDHWNWYANVKKCEDEWYVQCMSYDLPRPKNRRNEGMASDPILATCVALTKKGGHYKVIFGEKFNRKKKKWNWIENDLKDIIDAIIQ